MEVLAGKLTPGIGIRATRQSLGWLSAPQKPRPAPAITEPAPMGAVAASESLHQGEPLLQRQPELPAVAGEVQTQAPLAKPETTAEPVIEETSVPAPGAVVETPANEAPAIPDKPAAAPSEEVPEAATVANDIPIGGPALPAPLTSERPDAPPVTTPPEADRDIPAAVLPETMDPPAANAAVAAAEPAKAHPETQPGEPMEQPAATECHGIQEEAKPATTAFEPLASAIREWVPLAMSHADLTEKALRFAGSTLGWTLVAQTVLFVPFCFLVSQEPPSGSFEKILLGGIPLAAMGIIVAGHVSSRAAQIALDHLDSERAGHQPAAPEGERDTRANARDAINARKLAYLPALVVLGILLAVWLWLGLTVWFPAAKN